MSGYGDQIAKKKKEEQCKVVLLRNEMDSVRRNGINT